MLPRTMRFFRERFIHPHLRLRAKCYSLGLFKNSSGYLGKCVAVGGIWLLLILLMWILLHQKRADTQIKFDSFDRLVRAQFQPDTTTSTRMAFRTPTLLHVTHGGRVVEGAFVKKRGFKDRKMWSYRKVGCDKFSWGEYRPVNNSFSCYWCPVGVYNALSGKCLQGNLLLTQQERDDFSSRIDAEFQVAEYHMAQRPMTNQENKRNVPHETFAVSCTFQDTIPVGVVGNLIFEAPRRVQLMVDAFEPVSSYKDVVCLKPLYGTVLSADRLTSFAKFYLNRWRFDAVIVYELGMSFPGSLVDIVRANRDLEKFYEEGRLVILDLRDALQRMYGAWAHDAVFFTREYGQLLALNDCITRGKSHGLRWVLSVDIDEYLTYGKSHASRPGTWQEYAAKKELAIASGKLSVLRFDSKLRVRENEDRSVCDLCADQEWDEDAAAEFHKQNENNSHWEMAQLGKFAVRVDADYIVSEFPLSVHFYQPLCPGRAPVNEILVDGGDMYIRHYRQCANDYSKCEGKPSSPWDWYDF